MTEMLCALHVTLPNHRKAFKQDISQMLKGEGGRKKRTKNNVSQVTRTEIQVLGL